MKPKDYNLPHDSWRPHQKEALDLILSNSKTLILEMPTGTGKTALAAATGNQDKALSMVATRDLQQQYADIYNFSVIWGRTHYPCTDIDKVKRWRKKYGFAPNAGDCSKMKECPIICPYKQAKFEAIKDNKAVMNYHYGWYSEWWKQRGGYLFCDEAHNLAISAISGLAQLRVSEKQRQKWNMPRFPACSGTTEWAKDQVYDWLKKAIGTVGQKVGNMEDDRDRSKGSLLLRKLVMLRKLLPNAEWWVDGQNYGDAHLICRPVNPWQFSDRLLGHHHAKVLMSATIGDAAMLACELGIDNYEFHSFPHNIPQSQRPVFLCDAPAMSYRSTYKDYELQADVIAGLCHRHLDERIVIHVTRWKHAQDLQRRLSRKGLSDRLYVPNPQRGRISQIANLLTNKKKDMVAIGPSFWEGLDLRGDLCRVIIVAKVPFQDRKDPIVAARLKQEGGQKWDRWVAALKVVQGCGRAVRDETDYAVSYIADSNWERVAKYAPQWFEVGN